MASPRKRPRSRDSTASMHSTSTQPKLDQAFNEASDIYAAQWLANGLPDTLNTHSQHRELAPAPPTQMTPEDILLASQLQAGQDFMDGSVGPSMHNASLSQAHNGSRQSFSAESFAGNGSFADDSQMLDRDGNEEGDSFAGASLPVKSTWQRTNANNEQEMRQLFNINRERTLEDVANDLHGNERGPSSERNRQVFAMLWINQVCSKGKGSVPRGRVYANYASRCATERITVLNPASFGKLVRVLFPGLKTRRLGVRGESKYHYVGFLLAEDNSELGHHESQSQIPLGEGPSFSQSFNTLPNTVVSAHSERAHFQSLDVTQEAPKQILRSHEFSHSLYNQRMLTTMDQVQSTKSKTAQTLTFSPELTRPLQPTDSLVLPGIESFLPAGTDPDAAKSLTALYRSHSTSLVECMRYCKEKSFFHLFTSFQGTLTMPVQKLFGHPAIAPWIEECDFILYQRMMRIISILTLQVIPKPVLDVLQNIAARLVPHIRESFQGQPFHVVRAKEAPATIFASLLSKALRVNLTAHAAANMLSNPANRDLMYLDWVTLIDIRKVAESVPTRGMDDTVMVLLTEMRDLLDPADVSWDLDANIHGEVAMLRGKRGTKLQGPENPVSTIIERWVRFLDSLPQRFPYASHTDVVWCVQRIGTTIMRDITIEQGKSFNAWWVTKCWVDEQIQFMAEHGGFMQQTSAHSSLPLAKQHNSGGNLSNPGSRYSSGSDDFNMSHVSQTQPDRAPFPSAPAASNEGMNNQGSHDDSGIGIRTPEEELPPMDDKFSFTPAANTQDLFAGTELADL